MRTNRVPFYFDALYCGFENFDKFIAILYDAKLFSSQSYCVDVGKVLLLCPFLNHRPLIITWYAALS